MIKVNGEVVRFEVFPNGETKMVEDSINVDSVNNIQFKYEHDADFIRLMFVKKYLDTFAVVWSNNLIVLYMPYSRMDRSEGGSAFTLQYVADFINSLDFNSVVVVEPHSDVTPAVLNNAVPVSVIPQMLPEVMLDIRFIPRRDFLVFPDATADKRYNKSNDFNSLVGHKKRDFETGRITDFNLVGEGYGKKAIIVDDLSSRGGTFLLTASHLKERGFEEVYLVVGHAECTVFEGDLLSSGLIDKVFTTNTILRKFMETDNLKIFRVEDLLINSKEGVLL